MDETIVKYLDKHGYRLVATDTTIEIRYVQGYQNAITVIGLIVAFIFTMIGLAKPYLGFSIAGASILIAIISGLNVKGSLAFMLDFQSCKIKIPGTIYTSFHHVGYISLDSHYTDEYTSADKATSEVYTHYLSLITEGGNSYTILEFEEDYLEPSEGLALLYDFIKERIPRGY